MDKRKCLINFLYNLRKISSDWVAGKDASIVTMLKTHGLSLNTKLTTGLIDDLSKWGILLVVRESERDYMYKWNSTTTEKLGVVADYILKMKDPQLNKYIVGDIVHLMFDNSVKSAKVVDTNEDGIVVVFNTEKGVKSLVLNESNIDKYSLGDTKDDVIQRVVRKIN